MKERLIIATQADKVRYKENVFILKKVLVASLLAACSTAFAEGVSTDHLKASIDPNNVRIIYETSVWGAGHNLSTDKRFTFAQRD